MKRREIKFVAGSLQLAPDRIAAATLRKTAAESAKRQKPKRAQTRKPLTAAKKSR
jgi:hypothetical protein